MAQVHPIGLPEGMARSHDIDPEAKFWWTHPSVCTGPSGDRYVLSDLHYRRPQGEEREREWVGGHVLTRYAPDGSPLTQAFIEKASMGMCGHYPSISLCALSDGRILFSGSGNRTYAFDRALRTMEPVAAPGADQWAFRTRLTPSGRALCLLGENVIAHSQEPFGAEPPVLSAVTALMLDRPVLGRAPKYCPPGGASGEGAPATELVGQIGAASAAHTPGRGMRLEWVIDAVPVDDETFIVLTVGWRKYAGRRGGDFLFALVGDDGKLQGALDLHTHRDSAARGVRYDVVVDQKRRRIFHLNTFGLYAFDDSGARTLQLSTEDKKYKPLSHFQLRDFAPNGDLVLVHEKQNLVLTVPVPDDLADLPGAVLDALARFRKERTRLKKEHGPENWRWMPSGVPVTAF